MLFTKVKILIGSSYKSAHDLLGLSHKCTGTNYWLQHYCSRKIYGIDWVTNNVPTAVPHTTNTSSLYKSTGGEEVDLLIRERQERVGHAPLLAVSQVDCCNAQEWREPSDGVPKPVSRRAGSDERGRWPGRAELHQILINSTSVCGLTTRGYLQLHGPSSRDLRETHNIFTVVNSRTRHE